MAAQALTLSQGQDVRIAAAMTYAESGEAGQAQKIAEKLNAESPLDTLAQNYWLPSIRATLALHSGDANQAIKLLQVSVPYEMGLTNVTNMVPIYLRGMAFMKAGRVSEAAAEFEKMWRHRGVAPNAPIRILALLQKARAEAAAGDKASARRSYQDLLATWKQADSDLAALKQARSEYAAIKD